MKTSPKLIAMAVALALTPALNAQETLEVTRVEIDSTGSQNPAVKVINADQIEVEMIKDIFDTTRYIPGVSVNNTGNRFGDNGFNIRGLEGDAVAITVDGLSQGESLDPLTFSRYGMFSSTRNAIEPESVKTIEILKGANSVIAGSGALGGAVMYTTKDADDYLQASGDDFAGSVKLGYDGRNEEVLTNVALATRVGKLEALLIYTERNASETKTHDNGADILGPERGQADPFDSDKTNILAKLSYQFNDNHEAGFVFEDYESENQGRPLSRDSATYHDFEAFDESSRERFGVYYNWQANNALFDSAELKLDSQEIFTEGSTEFLFTLFSPTYLRNEDRNYQQELTSFTADFTKDIKLAGNSHSMVYGFTSDQTDVENQLQDIRYAGQTKDTGLRDGYPIIDPSWVPNTEIETWSAYLTDTIEISDQLTFQGGIRYDDTSYEPEVDDTFVDLTGTSVSDAEFSAFTWAANLQYEFLPNHSVIASIGTGFKAPTTQQLYLNTDATSVFQSSERIVDPNTGNVSYQPSGLTEIDLDTVTNPDLDAETSTNYELAYQWQGDNGYLNLSVFHSEHDDFIVNLNHSRTFNQAIIQATRDPFTPACSLEVIDDSCWSVSEVTEDTWGVPTNASEVEITGFEIDAGWQVTDSLLLTFAYSHTEGEYTNSVEGSSETNVDVTYEKGDDLESIAPDEAVLGLNYISAQGNWGATANARFIESKDFDESFSAQFYSDSAAVVDLSAFYDISENIVIRANVTNLFDEEYSLWQRVRLVREGNGGFFGGVAGNGIQRFNEPGREFAVNVSYTF